MIDVYCFFCENCGNETLAYDMLNSCPYCHARRETFRLLAKKEGEVQDEFRTFIDEARAQWIPNRHNRKVTRK